MDDYENLREIQLVAGFDDDEIGAFADACVRRSVPADHVFFNMGTLNSSLFIICAGSVKIERLGTADDIPLATLGAGQTFGEMSFMDGSRTTAAVTAAISPLKKASLTGFHATAKHIAAKAVSPPSETMRTI